MTFEGIIEAINSDSAAVRNYGKGELKKWLTVNLFPLLDGNEPEEEGFKEVDVSAPEYAPIRLISAPIERAIKLGLIQFDGDIDYRDIAAMVRAKYGSDTSRDSVATVVREWKKDPKTRHLIPKRILNRIKKKEDDE